MDKTTRYQTIILEMIGDMEGIKYSNEPELDTKLVIDKKNHRYIVVTTGWKANGEYIHNCSIHIEIINEKLWFHRNMTDIDFGKKLVYKGVPPSDIVAPKMRGFSDYAAA